MGWYFKEHPGPIYIRIEETRILVALKPLPGFTKRKLSGELHPKIYLTGILRNPAMDFGWLLAVPNPVWIFPAPAEDPWDFVITVRPY